MIDVAARSNPNKIAVNLTGRDYISWSAINTYRSCPLRYYFQYVVGLPQDTVSSSLVFGSAIHAAAEHHFNELMAGGPMPSLDTLLDVFQESWRERQSESIRFGKGEDVNSLGHLAERALIAFQQSDFARPQGNIIGVEEELRGEFMPNCPELLARIDLMIETDEALVVVDLKTARARWSSQQAENSAEQLLLYGELARHLIPGKPVGAEFWVLTKQKSPLAERFSVTIDHKRAARTRRVMQKVWAAIEAGHFYPSPSPMQCPGCAFREACRGWQG